MATRWDSPNDIEKALSSEVPSRVQGIGSDAANLEIASRAMAGRTVQADAQSSDYVRNPADAVETVLIAASQHAFNAYMDSIAHENWHRAHGKKSPEYIKELINLRNEHPPQRPFSAETREAFTTAFRSYEVSSARLLVDDYDDVPEAKTRDDQTQEKAFQAMMKIGLNHGISDATRLMIRQVNHDMRAELMHIQEVVKKLEKADARQILRKSTNTLAHHGSLSTDSATRKTDRNDPFHIAENDDLVVTWWEQMRSEAQKTLGQMYKSDDRSPARKNFRKQYQCEPETFLTSEEAWDIKCHGFLYKSHPKHPVPENWKEIPGAPVSAQDPFENIKPGRLPKGSGRRL